MTHLTPGMTALLLLHAASTLGTVDPKEATDADRERCKQCEWTTIKHEGHCYMFEEIMPSCAQWKEEKKLWDEYEDEHYGANFGYGEE